MKTLLAPFLAVALSTGLCVWLSHVYGMNPADLKINGLVAFATSATAAFGTIAAAAWQRHRTKD